MTNPATPRGTRTPAAHAGRDPFNNHGIVNPPVYHASTVLFETVAELRKKPGPRDVRYGRYGTPTTFALEDAAAARPAPRRPPSASPARREARRSAQTRRNRDDDAAK